MELTCWRFDAKGQQFAFLECDMMQNQVTQWSVCSWLGTIIPTAVGMLFVSKLSGGYVETRQTNKKIRNNKATCIICAC